MSHRKRIQEHYEPRLSPHRESFDVLDWASAASQAARFEALTRAVPLEGLSLLDLGCGLGDLHAFLQRRGVACDYTGVDILEKMAAEAARRNPAGRFLAADIFSPDLPTVRAALGLDARPPFDVVFCSGAFNLNLGNNRDFLGAAVQRLLDLSRRYVVFNLLHRRARHPSSDKMYFYADPQDVLAMLTPLGCRLRVIEDYLDNDFTVVCQKDAAP